MTIKDLARLAGVSAKTVSRVINEEAYVTQMTKEKVLKVIKETNYKPNIYAQSLRKKVQRNILVSILKPKFTSIPQWIEILVTELVEYGNKLGYTVLMETYSDIEDIKKVSMLNSSAGFLDGVIIFYEKKEDPRLELIKDSNIPYIIFDKAHNQESSYVTNDDYGAMFKGTNYLISRRCFNIELLLGNESPTNIEREKGAYDAYKKNKLSLKKLKVQYGIINVREAYRYTKKRLEEKDLPEAFFVSGDEKVLGIYKAINEKGLDIPKDISIMGFDNIPNSEYYSPSLTTLEQNYYKMSEAIFNYLAQKHLENEIIKTEIETKLVIRDSVK